MSFRRRLTQFFLVIVVVPMVAVSLVLFRLVADNQTGKADAGLAAGARAAAGLYKEAGTGARARAAVAVVASDATLARTLGRRDFASSRRRARRLIKLGVASRIRVSQGGSTLFNAGSPAAVAPIIRLLVRAGSHRSLGNLEVSVVRAPSFLRSVARVTGLVVVPSGPGLPAPGRVADVTYRGGKYRATTLAAQGFGDRRILFSLLGPRAATGSALRHGYELEGAVLVGFFALAVAFALLISRSLQAQIADFLAAARRLGSGDFSQPVPVRGGDEFAALGTEFNRMSERLEEQLQEVRRQRARIESSLQRIGETFAAKLDRSELAALVLRTAVEGLEAAGGRASVREPAAGLQESTRVGELVSLEGALRDAEQAALRSGRSEVVEQDGVHALAHPVSAADEAPGGLGVIAVARRGRAFGENEGDLLAYLARQAAVSMENVELHELVQRQAMTDELTGLYNHRRFYSDLATEVERARRFEHPVGLVLLDLDNFKRVNDTYGHQQGDEVLRTVARVLRRFSREVDSPARYGGEELALLLPQTDLDGAYQLAERLREGIQQMQVRMVGDEGNHMSVTASLGVAAMPQSGDSPNQLIGSADAALYEAKRSGKNMTVRAR